MFKEVTWVHVSPEANSFSWLLNLEVNTISVYLIFFFIQNEQFEGHTNSIQTNNKHNNVRNEEEHDKAHKMFQLHMACVSSLGMDEVQLNLRVAYKPLMIKSNSTNSTVEQVAPHLALCLLKEKTIKYIIEQPAKRTILLIELCHFPDLWHLVHQNESNYNKNIHLTLWLSFD